MVEELLPAVVAFVTEMNVDNGIPFGFNGFLNEFHIGLLRGSAAFF